MAQQEDGWPLGLQPLNERIGLVRIQNISGSISFTTLFTGSSSSSMDSSSSDLDTQSTGSFFMDRSITLGNLIGLPALSQLSRRSTRRRMSETDQKKTKSWLFSLCSKLTTDAINTATHHNSAPSLGRFLEQERRARRINHNSSEPMLVDNLDRNSLFVEGQEEAVVPREDVQLDHGDINGYGVPSPFSCMCAHIVE